MATEIAPTTPNELLSPVTEGKESNFFRPRIWLVADLVGKGSKSGIHGVSTTFYGITEALLRLGYADTQIINGQNTTKKYIHLPFFKNVDLPAISPVHIVQLVNKFRKGKPSAVVIAPEGTLGATTLAICKTLHIPTIGTYTTNLGEYAEHASNSSRIPFRRSIGRFWHMSVKSFQRYLYNHVDIVTVPSDGARKKVIEMGIPETKIQLLPRGIDTQLFHRKQPRESNPYEEQSWYRRKNHTPPKVVLFVGRISPEKNFQELLSLLNDPEFSSNNIHIVFVGPINPSVNDTIQQALKTHKDSFHYLGSVDHGEKLASLYRFADVFASPSMSETHGHTINEALVSGIPVVVPENEVTSKRVVDKVTGAIYTSGDTQGLKQAIINALQIPTHVPQTLFDQAVAQKVISWETSAKILATIAESLTRKREDRRRSIRISA